MKVRSEKEEGRSDEVNGSYEHCLKQERDRERKWRMSRQGAFVSSMLSLDDSSMRGTSGENSPAWASDRGRGADLIYDYEEHLRIIEEQKRKGHEEPKVDPVLKKRMLNKLRKFPALQKTLRQFIKNATSKKQKPVKETHLEKICEILFEPIKSRVKSRSKRKRRPRLRKNAAKKGRFKGEGVSGLGRSGQPSPIPTPAN